MAILGSTIAIYIGLKTGVGMGFSFTGIMLWFFLMRTLRKHASQEDYVLLMTLVDTAIALSFIFIGPVPALVLQGEHVPNGMMMFFIFLGFFIGITASFVMKKFFLQINLPFPMSMAAVGLIKTITTKKERLGKFFVSAFLFASFWTLLNAMVFHLFNVDVATINLSNYLGTARFAVSLSPALLGIGLFIGVKSAFLIFFAMGVLYLLLGPFFVANGILSSSYNYVEVVEVTRWYAIGIIVSATLTLFLKTVYRTLHERQGKIFGISKIKQKLLVLSLGLGIFIPSTLAFSQQDIQLPLALFLGSIFSLLISISSTYVAGETSMLVSDSMVYSMLLVLTLLVKTTSELLLFAIMAVFSSDLMTLLITDLKVGWVTKTQSTKQFFVAILGFLVTLGFATMIFTLFSQSYNIGSPWLPSPMGRVWQGIAISFSSSQNFSIDPLFFTFLSVGAALITFFGFSSINLGLGLLLPYSIPPTLFIGSLLGVFLSRRLGKENDYMIPIASGMIAGESITTVILLLLNL